MTTRARAIHLKHQNQHLLCKADKIDLNRLALNRLKPPLKNPTGPRWLTPPPPYGQPDHKISGFFATSLSAAKNYLKPYFCCYLDDAQPHGRVLLTALGGDFEGNNQE